MSKHGSRSRFDRFLIVVLALTLSGSESQAEVTDLPKPRRELGWLPSVTLGVDLQIEKAGGDLESFFADSTPLRPAATGTRDFFSAVPDVEIELMSPPLAERWGSPRLFAHAGYQWGWDVITEDRFVVKEGVPGPVFIPEQDDRPNGPPAASLDGQGSELRAEIGRGWYAGLGASFTVDMLGRDVQIKPSVDYYRQSIDLTGFSQGVTCTDIGPPRFNCVWDTYDVHTVSASDDEHFSGVGPRVALELDVLRTRSMLLSIFTEGYVFFVLGSRDVTYTGTNADGESATFEYRKDSTVAGAGIGLRMTWTGLSP